MRSYKPIGLLILLVVCSTANAGTINVAVAANFAMTLDDIVDRFTEQTGIQVKVSKASTGTIYAQIINGAPYDVFLAADTRRPAALEAKKLTRQRFIYAIGRLCLWAPGQTGPVDESFLAGFDGRLAIADPSLAPYGAAAASVIERLSLQPARLVKGSNVAQAFQFVESGNVDAGFVALAQVKGWPKANADDYWVVAPDYYPAIHQQAVVMINAPAAADEFADFLRSREVRGIIEADGYLLPGS